jgi:hypothetical protein
MALPLWSCLILLIIIIVIVIILGLDAPFGLLSLFYLSQHDDLHLDLFSSKWYKFILL